MTDSNQVPDLSLQFSNEIDTKPKESEGILLSCENPNFFLEAANIKSIRIVMYHGKVVYIHTSLQYNVI